MKPTKEQFIEIIKTTEDMATKLCFEFPDPRDAIMSLSLILVSLSKSIDMPTSKIIGLIQAIDRDLEESRISKEEMH